MQRNWNNEHLNRQHDTKENRIEMLTHKSCNAFNDAFCFLGTATIIFLTKHQSLHLIIE